MTTSNITASSAPAAPVAAEKTAATPNVQPGLFALLLSLLPAAKEPNNTQADVLASAPDSGPPAAPNAPAKPAETVLTLAQAYQMLLADTGAADGASGVPVSSPGTLNTAGNCAAWPEEEAGKAGAAPDKDGSGVNSDALLDEQEKLALALNTVLMPQFQILKTPADAPEQAVAAGKAAGLKTGSSSVSGKEGFDFSVPKSQQPITNSQELAEEPIAQIGKSMLPVNQEPDEEDSLFAKVSLTVKQSPAPRIQRVSTASPSSPVQDNVDQVSLAGAQTSGSEPPTFSLPAIQGAGDQPVIVRGRFAGEPKQISNLGQPDVQENPTPSIDHTEPTVFSSSGVQNPQVQLVAGEKTPGAVKQEPALAQLNAKEDLNPPAEVSAARASTPSSSSSDAATSNGNKDSSAKTSLWTSIPLHATGNSQSSLVMPHEAVEQYAAFSRESTRAAERKILPAQDGNLKSNQEITTSTLGLSSVGSNNLSTDDASEANASQKSAEVELVKATVTAIPNPLRATTIEIRPEGLGSIQIRISPQNTNDGSAWRIDIRATNPTAHALLTDHLGALRESLKTQNVNVAGVSVGHIPTVEVARQASHDTGQGQEEAKGGFKGYGRQQREEREHKERFTLMDDES